MQPLSEMLRKNTIDKTQSSLLYRVDFSEATYHFTFDLDKSKSISQIKRELVSDFGKITKSVINNTGGIKEVDKQDKEGVEIDYSGLVDEYGYYIIPVDVIFPKDIESPSKRTTKYNMFMPGRPVIRSINRYYSKVNSIVSDENALIRNRFIAKRIMDGVTEYGIDKINSIEMYVYNKGNRYRLIIVFNFSDNGDELMLARSNNAKLAREIEKETKQRIQDEKDQYEREREEYFISKNEFLKGYSGPSRYYAEKKWLRENGDWRFEDTSSMRNSNFTGD